MNITFGRFSDAFKPKSQTNLWNECEKLYNEKKYFESYKLFLDYLKDSDLENVFYSIDNGFLKFQVIQGSKEIRGYFDGSRISAISVIAGYDSPNVAVFRRLMEMNYTLYYCRFAVKDNRIVLKFDSNVLDCSPNKFYYGLRELAIRADKQDDTLISEFKSLTDIESKAVPYSKAELDTIKKYFREWINSCLERVSGLNKEQYSGGISYIYLNVLYKIDYLLMPQGVVLNEIQKMSWTYFNDKESALLQKLDSLCEDLKKIKDYDDAKLERNFYNVITTFGIAPPAGKQSVDDSINNNIQNIKWYLDNSKPDIALNILEYIAGFCLFSYGLNRSLRNILGLIIEVINHDYVSEIGSDNNLVINESVNKDYVVNKLTEFISLDKDEYPELNMNFENIKFDTILNFTKSTLEEISKLNYKN
ncbi:MAG: hypothetical protein WC139_14105 [Candidatus Kapaibacterium sp.]